MSDEAIGVPCAGLVIATPAHGGVVYTAFSHSLSKTEVFLRQKWGLPVTTMVAPSDSCITRSRNLMLHKFLHLTTASHFMFIDADIEWEPEAVERLIAADFDIAVGAYPFKRFPPEFVMRPEPREDGSAWQDGRTGFIRVHDAPTGFMMIKRGVFERMIEAYPETKHRLHDPDTGETGEMFALFDFGIEDGEYWTEDYLFCRRWRRIGGEVWLDPKIHLKHWGLHGFDAGRPADHIRSGG